MTCALTAQRTEITEHHIYMKLAERSKNESNANVLKRIGLQEKMHADYWQTITGKDLKPNRSKVRWIVFLAGFLGLTFVLKLMEKREGTGSKLYTDLNQYFPGTDKLAEDEQEHEKEILNMLVEKHLKYVGSIVLGLNDALVEVTGALAGFTLALGDTRVSSLAGLVTGISAAFSMAASDYLSSKADNEPHPGTSAMYTGLSYIVTVALLIMPFLLVGNKFIALGIVLSIAVLIIFGFNYYISVAKDLNFKRRFLEMTLISLGVAAFSFLAGYGLKALLGVDA